jgi:hypothetical protein
MGECGTVIHNQPVEAKQPAIRVEQQNLGCACDELQDSLTKLEQRLEPIMHESPGDQKARAEPPSLACPMARELRGIVERISHANIQARDLADRLEI